MVGGAKGLVKAQVFSVLQRLFFKRSQRAGGKSGAMESSPDDDHGDVPRQLELSWIAMVCCTRATFSGWWRGGHSSSIIFSIAARQIMVQRR